MHWINSLNEYLTNYKDSNKTIKSFRNESWVLWVCSETLHCCVEHSVYAQDEGMAWQCGAVRWWTSSCCLMPRSDCSEYHLRLFQKFNGNKMSDGKYCLDLFSALFSFCFVITIRALVCVLECVYVWVHEYIFFCLYLISSIYMFICEIYIYYYRITIIHPMI